MPSNATPRQIHAAAYFWPGLPQLWTRGSWAGLAIAVGFTALGNVLLLATLVYTEWISGEHRLIGFGVLASVWLLAWGHGHFVRRRLQADLLGSEGDQAAGDSSPLERDPVFREAQQCYLRSDWVATERLLLKLLKQDPRDVEGRLMLATLWRHQQRPAEALRQLERLSRLEAAEQWKHEIEAERQAIAQLQQEHNEPPTVSLVHEDCSNDPDENETDENVTDLDDRQRRRAA